MPTAPGPYWRLLVLAPLLAVVAACGLFEGERPTLSPTSTTVVPTEPSVLDPGREPRRVLRYELTAGQETTSVISVRMSVDQTSEGSSELIASPGLSQTIRFTVTGVDGSGADLAFVVESAEVDRSGTTLSDEDLFFLTGSVRQLVGLTGSARITDRGAMESFVFEAPDGLDGALVSALELATGRPDTLTLPLPSEPVGVGARWETVTSIDLGSNRIDQTAVYTVTEIDGNLITYTGTISQRGSHRSSDGPVTPGTGGHQGTVEGRLDLSALTPVSSTTLSGTITQTLPTDSGTPREVVQVQEMAVTVSSMGDP